jgi:cellulose synthase/poly-beta-1,6-N-acetylglucosamine synthase-like glycosyltransferase
MPDLPNIAVVAVYAAMALYCLRTLIFMLGAYKERRKRIRYDVPSLFTPFVSVVVPARNEEENIAPCVVSLMQSDYPLEFFEVIVVNDRSSDKTGDVLSGLQAKYPNLIVHNTSEDTTNTNLQGKPRAVHQGIMRSRGEFVLMTDADCLVPPTWISAIAHTFQNPHIGLIASYTLAKGARFFDRLQMLEWLINNTMASAGVGLGQPLGCFGNNLSVRRRVYDELGGYPHIRFSLTEDLALLQAVTNAGHEARYICAHETHIDTQPCPDIPAFIKQHHRWVNGGKALGWRAVGFVVSSSAMWLGIVLAVASASWGLLALLLAVRTVSDMALTYPAFRELRMAANIAWIPIAEPFFLLIELMTPFLGLKSSVEWKGQILRNHP